MLGQKSCPICRSPSSSACSHLALAVEARDFVRCCVQECNGEASWRTLCDHRRALLQRSGEWSPEREDFTWLETAFCDEFLKRLVWFGGIDYEWRTGPRKGQGGVWVLLWSKDPRALWWELNDELCRQEKLPGPPIAHPSAFNAGPQLPYLSA